MHKTVISAERLLINVILRVKELHKKSSALLSSPSMDYFFKKDRSEELLGGSSKAAEVLARFMEIDDNELLASIRIWKGSNDRILSDMADRLLSRDLLAIELQNIAFDSKKVNQIAGLAKKLMNLEGFENKYYVFSGEVSNRAYAPSAPSVKILTKDGDLKEITEVSDMLNHEALSQKITKYFLCYPKQLRPKNK